MLRQDDLVKAQLVLTGYRFGQSYGGGHMAAQMVMHAIGNRVKNGWGTWLQVIERIPNFMAENELPPLVYPSLWEPLFVKLLHAVDGVFDGSMPDLAKGGMYWGQLNRIERTWFKEKVLGYSEVHPRVADMNSLSFFK